MTQDGATTGASAHDEEQGGARPCEPIMSPTEPHSEVRSRNWAEQLLSLSLEYSLDDSPEVLVDSVVRTLGRLLPSHAVGASIQLSGDDAPYVVRHRPAGCAWPTEAHATRLFPRASREDVAVVASARRPSTLHIASVDGLETAAEVKPRRILDRAARLLEVALARLLEHQVSRDEHRLSPQFIQSEKLASIGRIAAGVVHELNNPLTSIITYAGKLSAEAEALPDSARARVHLARIAEAADRIQSFTRDLVAYSRPACGPKEPVTVSDIAERGLLFCSHELSSSGVQVDKSFDVGVPRVHAVKEQLAQVFVNLFTNAAHAMRHDGGTLKLTITSPPPKSEVHVEVGDDGEGIPESTLHRVFEPFFTTKSESHGTGLGLSIVREIVRRHGGEVDVESAPGRGAVFRVRLPIAHGDANGPTGLTPTDPSK